MSERDRFRDAFNPPGWTTSKQRSSVDDIYTELDWLKTYLVEKDIWDSACWAHYTRLRSLCATWIRRPKRTSSDGVASVARTERVGRPPDGGWS